MRRRSGRWQIVCSPSLYVDGKKKVERKRATEWMWWSEREKRRIRFHPGSPAVLLIEVSTLGGGGIQPIKIKLHFHW